MKLGRISIDVRYTVDEIKEKYRTFFGLSHKSRVKREDLKNWLSAMIDSELESIKKSPKS